MGRVGNLGRLGLGATLIWGELVGGPSLLWGELIRNPLDEQFDAKLL